MAFFAEPLKYEPDGIETISGQSEQSFVDVDGLDSLVLFCGTVLTHAVHAIIKIMDIYFNIFTMFF